MGVHSGHIIMPCRRSRLSGVNSNTDGWRRPQAYGITPFGRVLASTIEDIRIWSDANNAGPARDLKANLEELSLAVRKTLVGEVLVPGPRF